MFEPVPSSRYPCQSRIRTSRTLRQLRQMEVERVEQLDGRVRGVYLDVTGDVQQPLAVVEDDLHAGVDEVVGDSLCRRRRNGEHPDDDVLVPDSVPQVVVRLHLDEIGRASCRERVESAVGGGSFKKNTE